MSGCYIGLFTKRSVMPKVKDLYMSKVKTGMGGFAKNKGSVSLRFKIDETTFAFLNCHLASGEGNINKRTDMLESILDEAFIKAKGLPKAANHHSTFLFGDLNFRVNLNNKVARQAVSERKLENLLQYDELTILKNAALQ